MASTLRTGWKGRRIDDQPSGWVGEATVCAPANNGAVTPADATIYDPPLRVLYVGGAGNLAFVCDGNDEADANNVTTIAVTAGQILDMWAIRCVRTATTATGLVGWP